MNRLTLGNQAFKIRWSSAIKLLLAFAFLGAAARGAVKVGSLPGSVDVSNTGTASYTIPIEVAPGTGGFEPVLKLIYNSNSRDGFMGYGWSLGGLSSISRIGTNEYLETLDKASFDEGDFKTRGVQYNYNDRFSLDGNRLVHVNSGTYGGNGAEYRTEVDTFAEVKSYGTHGSGPSYFKVRSKDGLTFWYGNTTDSKLVPAGKNTIAIWAVNRIEDAAGNSMTIEYQNLGDDSALYPKRIDYSYDNSTSEGDWGANSVRFSYASKTYPSTSYAVGSKFEHSHMMSSIDVYEESTKVRTYTLAHTLSGTKRWRLDSVTLSAGGDSLPATIFDYEDLSSTEIESIALDSPYNTAGHWPSDAYRTNRIVPIDIDGDGKSEFLKFNSSVVEVWQFEGIDYHDKTDPELHNTGISVSIAPDWYEMTLEGPTGDFNGDGKTDFLVPQYDGGWSLEFQVKAYLSNGSGFDSPIQAVPFEIAYDSPEQVLAPDLNGDGRSDLVVLRNDGLWGITATSYLSHGTYFEEIDDRRFGFSNIAEGGFEKRNYLFYDFDGDGMDDFVIDCKYRGDPDQARRVYIWKSNGDGNFASNYNYQTVAASYNNNSALIPMDLNADGLTDLFYTYKSGSNVYYQYFLGTGTSYVASSVTNGFSFNHSWSSEMTVVPMELDGDGRGDIAYIYRSSGLTLRRFLKFRGDSFEQSNGWFYYNNWKDKSTRYSIPMDVEGNGKTDIVFFEKISNNYRVYPWLATGKSPDLLTSTTNGLGESTKIDYGPLSSDAYYQTTDTSTYPIREVRGGYMVVNQLHRDDGLGTATGDYSTHYIFTDAKVDQYGRGFLGMKASLSVDVEKDEVIASSFSQDFPTTGMMYTTSKMLLNNDPITNETIPWAYAELVYYQPTHLTTKSVGGHSVSYFPYVGSSQTYYYEVSDYEEYLPTSPYRRIDVTNTYDVYGNNKVNTTKTYDQGSNLVKTLTTSSTYSNDTSNWHLGRLTDVQVAHNDHSGSSIVRKSKFEYDSDGLLKKETIEPNDYSNEVAKTYSRDGFGNVTREQVAYRYHNGSSWTLENAYTYFSFDSNRRYVTWTRNAIGQISRAYYNKAGFGVPTSTVDINGLTTTYEYDNFGRATLVTGPDGVSVKTEYLSSTTSGLTAPSDTAYAVKTTTWKNGIEFGARAISYHDRLGREIRAESESYYNGTIKKAFVDTCYDQYGRAWKKSDPYLSGETVYWTETFYDGQERPEEIHKQTENSGTIKTTYSYDQHIAGSSYYGPETTVTTDDGGKNQHKSTKLNALGQKIAVVDNNGKAVAFTYDDAGNLKTTTDSKGNVITLNYDSKGYNKTSMADPDMGTWHYEIDALGRLRKQTDARGTVTRNNYDLLGRMTSRTIGSSSYTYTYDGASGAGKGKPYQEWGPDGFYKYFTYDSYGRVVNTTHRFDDYTDDNSYQYQMTNSYDSYGRLDKIHYPSVPGHSQRYFVQNVYDSWTGVIKEVKDSQGQTWWKSPKYDALGRLESYTYGGGNLVRTDMDYEGGTGFLKTIKGYKNGYGSPTVQNWSFTFDDVGNLTYRKNHLTSKSENYAYDSLNRVKWVNGVNKVNYDELGNITWKSGLGSYQYLSSRPHAVTKINGSASYGYDANGNMTSYGDRTITWTKFNKPDRIIKGSSSVKAEFQYDAHHNRIAEYELNSRKHYMARIYERVFTSGSSTKHRHLIPTPAGIVGSYEAIEYGATSRSYFHKDHLGSIVKVTNDNASTIKTYAYDVWGAPASTSTWSPLLAWDHEPSEDRGFTGHEMLDNVQLVHMNGRVYDPKMGRFLSPDTFIQESADLQNYNRYSYVLNNPLSYTDPSGHFVSIIAGIIAQQIGLNATMQMLVVAATTAAQVAVEGGSTSDIVRAFGFSMMSAGVMNAVGGYFDEYSQGFWGEFGRAATHGATQGMFTEMQGGDFMSGFASAFVASAAGSAMGTKAGQEMFNAMESRVVAAAIIGGTASELSGGSFTNGAITGAFVQMFNHEHESGGSDFDALDGAELTLDVAGFFDPTPTADLTNASILAAQGEYLDAGLTTLGVVPVVGDAVGKGLKWGGRGVKKLWRWNKMRKLNPSQLRGIRSLERQIDIHKQKIDDFKRNPTVRPGMEHLPADVIKRQQQRRIEHLRQEIRTFEGNIKKIMNGEQ
ncbi:FG-GAP-like repeat-containing protein [Puniceicoccaceae bacterium K14]|nr:FG-GAP-like repeat-containing protein [Puniceicoccaceae bacterium K14]